MAKILAFWLLIAATAILFWRYPGPRVPMRETLFVVLFGFALFWAIRVSILLVRHEKRISNVESKTGDQRPI
jgi:hypothetical protein